MKLLSTYIRLALAISILIVFLTSCDSSDCGTRHVIQDFFLEDENGNDLLDPDNEESINIYNINNLTVCHLINGKLEKFKYKSGVKKFSDNKHYFTIGLNEKPSEGNITYTYLEWDANNIDTIKSIIRKNDCVFLVNMQSYNDSIWSVSSEDYIFTIVK